MTSFQMTTIATIATIVLIQGMSLLIRRSLPAW
jgi:hypothetical protein